MGLLRNSVIVGGATFLVGSALMEISKGDSKNDIGWWPYVATFISGAAGFYLLKQEMVPVPEALELNAEMDGEKLMVSSFDFDDGSMMVGIGTEENVDDDPEFMEMLIDEDGKIDYFSLPIGKEGYQRHYQVKPSHYGKMKTQNQTNERAGGDFVRTDGDGKYGTWSVYMAEEGEPCPNCKCSHENLKMIDSYNDGGTFWINMVCQDCGLEGGSYTDEVQWEDEGILQASPQIAYNMGNPNFGALKCSRCMQRFEMAAESFSAERKARRRSRLSWTKGMTTDFLEEDGRYMDDSGRMGYQKNDTLYHIDDLPNGYHIHLRKPVRRGASWKAVAKSPHIKNWKHFTSYKKSQLSPTILNWYNTEIAKPEFDAKKLLTPIEKMMMNKGLLSKTPTIIRTTPFQNNTIWYAQGGPEALPTTEIARLKGTDLRVSLGGVDGDVKFANNFLRGLILLGPTAGDNRSVNRYNKDSKAWVDSKPAWFKNACAQGVFHCEFSIKEYNYSDRIEFLINGYKFAQLIPRTNQIPELYIYPDATEEEKVTPRPTTTVKLLSQASKVFTHNIPLIPPKQYADALFPILVEKYQPQNKSTFTRRMHPIWGTSDRDVKELPKKKGVLAARNIFLRRYKKKE
jgi:hypothetical protein